MRTKIILIVIAFFCFKSNSFSQNYKDYTPEFNGSYMLNDGSGEYNEIEVLSDASNKLFKVIHRFSYRDGGQMISEEIKGSIIIGGADEDETFVTFENDKENAYSIWFEQINNEEIICVIAFDYNEPTKYKGTMESVDNSEQLQDAHRLPDYIKDKNWYSDFYGQCYLSEQGGTLRIDGDGADKFIGYIEIFNEGYDDNGDGEYNGENDEPPYMIEYFIQCKIALTGDLKINFWNKIDVDYYEYSEIIITKSDNIIIINDDEYTLTECN